MMIYITQLIFLKQGKESVFLEFENFVLPIMEKYKGEMLYRIRPTKESYVSASQDLPFEIHFISFETEQGLSDFMQDSDRLNYIHLKAESIKSTFLVKGTKM